MYVPETTTRCGFRAKNFLEAQVRNIFRITSRNDNPDHQTERDHSVFLERCSGCIGRDYKT